MNKRNLLLIICIVFFNVFFSSSKNYGKVENIDTLTAIRKGKLIFSNKEYEIEFYIDNPVTNEITKHLPFSSECFNIGGEIYFRIPGVDIKYDDSRVEFEIGEIVYWRSPDGENKFAIAILYGNTVYSNWRKPQTSSPCVRIGKIGGDLKFLESIVSGEKIKIILKQ